MKIKTVELIDQALNWAVAKSLPNPEDVTYKNGVVRRQPVQYVFSPSTDWAQGGPIIEREGISWHCGNKSSWHAYSYGSADNFSGQTPLIAAMRCYVASKLGDEIELPEELK
jgi:hypothetical protein